MFGCCSVIFPRYSVTFLAKITPFWGGELVVGSLIPLQWGGNEGGDGVVKMFTSPQPYSRHASPARLTTPEIYQNTRP